MDPVYFDAIAAEVSVERSYQDASYGGFSHDLQHSPFEWQDLRREYERRALYYFVQGKRKAYRQMMIKVIALLMAEVETYDKVGQLQGEAEQLALFDAQQEKAHGTSIV